MHITGVGVGEHGVPTDPECCFDYTGENQIRFGRRPRCGTVEYEIGPDESVSTAVVRAVSAVEGRDPRSLRPLGEILDPAALDALFGSRDGGILRLGGRLTFVYSECHITIDNAEYLMLQPIYPRIRKEGPNAIDDGVR